MKVQTAKQIMQIQEWSAQVKTQKQSGQTVRQWCRENDVAVKSFYYHRRRIQEEMLEVMESGNPHQITSAIPSYMPAEKKLVDHSVRTMQEKPIFAAFSRPPLNGAAVTVRLGDFTVDIQNGADEIMMEQVLRVVARL